MIRIFILLALGFGLYFYFSSVPEGSPVFATRTTISDLLRAPDAHDGDTVAVTGKVLTRASLFGMGGFQIGDDKGNSIVVLGLAKPGALGSDITVTGTFMGAFSLNDLFLPVIMVSG